jgi:hypothetical protein
MGKMLVIDELDLNPFRYGSGPAHHLELLSIKLQLFLEEVVENCVIRCFKWFWKVFERLNPISGDFSTNS